MKIKWPRNPWLWISLVGLYIFLSLFFIPESIRSSPEFSQVTLFLKDNPTLTEAFGSVESIDLDSSNYEANWAKQGLFGDKWSCVGFYQFKVAGTKRSGVVLVHWKSTGARKAQIVSVDEVTSTGSYLSTLWKNPLEQAAGNPVPAESLPAGGQVPRVTVIDVCIYFFAGILVISLTGSLIYFWSRRHHEV
jgi:hypothetical protein